MAATANPHDVMSTKDLFLDPNLRDGGFYELSIQVCPSADNEPVRLYTDFIWSLDHVEGPFERNYTAIAADPANIGHDGILHLGHFAIPFLTFNLREEDQSETGFHWFDICFYTTAIEKVFGAEYQTWTHPPRVPEALENFFRKTARQLFEIYPFQLAMPGFEVSGQYYLTTLEKPLRHGWTPTRFFAGRDNYERIAPENRQYVTRVEDIAGV